MSDIINQERFDLKRHFIRHGLVISYWTLIAKEPSTDHVTHLGETGSRQKCHLLIDYQFSTRLSVIKWRYALRMVHTISVSWFVDCSSAVDFTPYRNIALGGICTTERLSRVCSRKTRLIQLQHNLETSNYCLGGVRMNDKLLRACCCKTGWFNQSIFVLCFALS